MTCTLGPCESTNAALMLSCDCWPTVCMKGNSGSVNGVVIPVCSNQIMP